MRQISLRVFLVGFASLLCFELLQQLAVYWKESTEEHWSTALVVVSCGGFFWALKPAFSRFKGNTPKFWLHLACSFALFVGLYGVICFYSWHLRPNLGLYREPLWVQQHTNFQRQLRARIEANLWKSKKSQPASPSQNRPSSQ